MIIKLSIRPLLIEGVFLPYDLEGFVILSFISTKCSFNIED